MGMFEYGIGLSAASSDKEMAIAKLAYLAGQSSVKSKILEILNKSTDYSEMIDRLKTLANSSDSVH